MRDTGFQVDAISPPRLIIEPTPMEVPHLTLRLPAASPRVTAAAAVALMLIALLGAMFGLGYLAGQII